MLEDNVVLYHLFTNGLTLAVFVLIAVLLILSMTLIPILSYVWGLIAFFIVAIVVDTSKPIYDYIEKTYAPITWQNECAKDSRKVGCFDDIVQKEEEVRKTLKEMFGDRSNGNITRCDYMQTKRDLYAHAMKQCDEENVGNPHDAEVAKEISQKVMTYLQEQRSVPEPLRNLNKVDEILNQYRR